MLINFADQTNVADRNKYSVHVLIRVSVRCPVRQHLQAAWGPDRSVPDRRSV